MRLHKSFFAILLTTLLATVVIFTPTLPALAATGTVTLSTSSGPPTTGLTAAGTGFTANSLYTVAFGSTVVRTGIVSLGGTVSVDFAVPMLPRGSYPVNVTTVNATTNTPLDTTLSPPIFAITPLISLNKTSGPVGEVVSVNGFGFAPSTTITIYFDGVVMTSVNSDVNGLFSGAVFNVPRGAGALHSVIASDFGSSSPSMSFSIVPTIALSTTTASVGSAISVSGTGFAASSTISFFLDDVAISGTVISAADGILNNASVTIPASPGGSHTIKVQDASGNSATGSISVTSSMTISPTSGPAGTNVTVTGKGFFASSDITVTFGGTAVTTSPSAVVTGANGSFIAIFAVPPNIFCVREVRASDGTNTNIANFSTMATATISPASGPVGTTITAKGAGFKTNGTITINYANVQAATVNTGAGGSFSTTFPALPSSTGNQRITISDGTNTLTFAFNTVYSAKISPLSGSVGSDITIEGTGFASNRAVTVKYDGNQINQINQSTSDTNGTFTAVFKAPASKGGSHSITVTDNANTVLFDFEMEATPPPVPTLLQPLDGSKAAPSPTLEWAEVTDPSGVTYTLQIATDATFAKAILEKGGLTTSAYKLSKEEALKSVSKNTPYYWRVKAIDGASNEGQWSKPFTFLVGLILPPWILYVIPGVGALIVGIFIGYILGRRSMLWI